MSLKHIGTLLENKYKTLQQVDLNLHGLAGIRLIDPAREDIDAVVRQTGLTPGGVGHIPDITIRFVDRLPISAPIRYLDRDDVGFTDDAFIVLAGKFGGRARAMIPFDRIGRRCEIVCESGGGDVPLLVPILNLTLLSLGIIAIHASAFIYRRTGVLATGWSKGGKTEALLAFMARGARFIGDEWIYMSDPESAFGVCRPFGVWGWCLDHLPDLAARVPKSDRRRLRLLTHAVRRFSPLVPSGPKSAPAKVLRLLVQTAERELRVNLDPRKVFGPEACALSGTIEKIVLVGSHESSNITMESISTREALERMVFSLQYERMVFMACYKQFRFAFPDRRNDLIENAESMERELLLQMLANKSAYALDHPYPVRIPALFEAASSVCG
jgi:hypothetical protein